MPSSSSSARQPSQQPSQQPSPQTTAMFMRSVLPAAEEYQILSCTVCGKATVPVPDPQRAAGSSHCYRCGMEHAVGQCVSCGAAVFATREGGDDENPLRCESCGSKA